MSAMLLILISGVTACGMETDDASELLGRLAKGQDRGRDYALVLDCCAEYPRRRICDF